MPEAQIHERGTIRYRADIDGLRAAAILPVVFYHYGIPGFSGGFVGVDVFFVISGFLITSLIAAEMRNGEFSIAAFYERRARRILPALFAMLAASAIAAIFILFPRDLIAFGESLAATALFGSNVDFWLRSGYFDVGANLKPLLHTWSLAVEEQYYLLFPALLYAVHARSRKSLLAMVALLALVSFAASLWAVAGHPSAAFYLMPFRFWELMLGAGLALVPMRVGDALLREILALAGLALIAGPIFGFTAHTPFPGLNALYPCLGTALLILTGERDGAAVNRALTWQPIVFIGLISYSLYLWHWPLYVFANYLAVTPLGLAARIALIVASFVLAWLSWRLIEQPFRKKRHLFTRPRLFGLAGVGVAIGIAFGLALMAAQGLPQRFSPDLRRILAEADDYEPLRHGCFNRSAAQVERGDFCTIGDSAAQRPSFILWGDSHADAILPAVAAIARDQHRKGYFIAHGRCPPLLDVRLSDESNDDCARLNRDVLAIAARDHIGEVIMTARWAYYEQGHGVGVDASDDFTLSDLNKSDPPASHDIVFDRLLRRTIQTLTQRGLKIMLIGDTPEPGQPIPEALARIARAGANLDIRLTIQNYQARTGGTARDFRQLEQAYPVTVLDPSKILCDADHCAISKDGRPLYFDDHHLSQFGAMQLVPLLAPAM